MKKTLFSLGLLATVLIIACGGGSSVSQRIDNTQPVSDENRVIYQMNIGAFTPEGTFQAAQQQLDRLDTLGIDIIWLMPIYPRGATMHSPYASMDFRGVNPSYGTVDDVKAFVARAHELGMKVWLDWVPNHVAQENPWVESHPEYFTKDAKGQMIHPHGWGDVLELNYQDEGKVEMLSETDITDRFNQRIDSCGFDYDYAWNFQGSLAQWNREQWNADSLKQICLRFLEKSSKVKNRRMVYLTNHDQNYNDGGHTLKDFYGDNRYGLTVLEFTFYGMPLIYNGQEIGDPDTLNYFTDAKVKWQMVDRKMLNTVRTLIALHHQQPSLAADAPVTFLPTSQPDVLAWKRGPVVAIVNFGSKEASTIVTDFPAGSYEQWLDSKTIGEKVDIKTVSLDMSTDIQLEPYGYAVYVLQ